MDSSIKTPLATLPLELLRKITSYLDLQDYVNLRASCTMLCMSLKSNEVCRAYVKDCMNFTYEAGLARKKSIDYHTAIQRTYLTRARFQLAKPYSVIVLGHGQGYFYNERILAYQMGDLIRILDVYDTAVTEDIIDLRSLLNEEAERWHPHTEGIRELLLSRDLVLHIAWMDCNEGILLIHIIYFDISSRILVVINVRKGIPLQERLLMIRRCSYGCVAKTDGRYIIVFEDFEYNGNLDLYDLEDKQQRIQKLHLPKCPSFYIEDRQIYDGWFYVLARDREDYNYCYAFPLEQSRPVTTLDAAGTELLPEQLQVVRVKRRQPRTRQKCGSEPYDRWPSLKLCRDQCSGQLVIVEGWHYDGKEDDALRIQYTFQPLQFPEPDFPIGTATDRNFYFNSVLQTLNPADLPLGERDCDCPRPPSGRLKARSYVPRASTFFDVFLGSEANLDSREEFGFHVAVGSCHRASPSESESGQLDKVSSNKSGGFTRDDNNEQQSVWVRRFPPNGAPTALFDLLCPTRKLKWAPVSLEQPRSIFYSTKRLHRKLNDTADQLVLTNFDPWIRFPGLEPMVLHPPSTPLTSKEYDKELARAKEDPVHRSNDEYEAKADRRRAKWAKIRKMNKAEREGKVWEPRSEWFWNERATYLDIKQGFQFS